MAWDPDIALESFFGSLREEIVNAEMLTMQEDGDDIATLSSKSSELRGKICVLSLDGGGMHGIIPARLLAHLEELLKQKSGDQDARIADYFDVVTGTSVGGLIATMLFTGDENSRPLFRAEEAWRLMAERGREVFKKVSRSSVWSKLRWKSSKTSWFSAKSLEQVFKEYLMRKDGSALTLRDTIKPVLIPCYDLATAAPFLFSRADALESQTWDFNLWEICRATTATPPFFPPACVTSVDGNTSCTAIDGRVVMHNPTAAAITHVLHNKREFPFVRGVEDLLVLSLGTGQIDQTYMYDTVRGWGTMQWVKSLAKIVLDGVADTVDHTISMAFGEHRKHYLRIQMAGLPNKTETDVNDVNQLLKLSEDLLDQKSMEFLPFGGRMPLSVSNRDRLDWFAEQLVKERKSRRSCILEA
nr:patatin-like protein 6 isoform X2 [Physcomitrium patens]|eukprot:XP_024378379.1 patatin-like protein 6 isoform X2 [Physcomitrella patens]